MLLDEFGLKLTERDGKAEFADIGFDGDFPEGDDADEDLSGGLNPGTGAGRKLRIVFEEPEEGVGVEEDGHGYI